MKLSIVIPAYNEEQAISSTIERCLAARESIARESPVNVVEIIVVSDGSTDRTASIASEYDEITLIEFERNRGYGAAIKKGFEVATGELVGFLDADGTCEPRFFAVLCDALRKENATVAIGSRLGAESHMPRIRRIGNRVYALLLSLLSNRVVSDTASGMRVIRRDALPLLYPLPDGLQFTPAMSARVLMDDRLKIIECPMPYEERVGQSKLHVARDGVRFLRAILGMTLAWRPARVFLSTAAIGATIMTLLAVHPVEMWVTTGKLREDMIYRLLFCSWLGALAAMLVSASMICECVTRRWRDDARPKTFLGHLLRQCYASSGLVLSGLLMLPLVGWLIGPGIWSYFTRGLVVVHWSRVVLAGMVSLAFGQMFVTHLTLRLIHFHADRQSAASTGTILKESRMSALNIEGDGRGRARVDDVEGLTLEKNV